MSEVVLFGDINVDVLMSIPQFPDPGGDAMAEQVTLRPGGSVANTVIVLAKLGMSTKIIGRTGDDHWADIAMQPITNVGVDVSEVSRDPHDSTGLIFIPVTRDGERTMFSYRGANIRKSSAEISSQIFSGARLLHISSYNLLESPQKVATRRALDFALTAGLGISMDIGVEPAIRIASDLVELLPSLSHIILSMEEAQRLVHKTTPGSAADELLLRGVEVVGLKLGSAGCLVADANNRHTLPGYEVVSVDTTGAGDAFCAGLLFGWMQGLSLAASGLLANALGALATTVWGCGSALPGRDEVVSLLQEQLHLKDDMDVRSWTEEVLELLG